MNESISFSSRWKIMSILLLCGLLVFFSQITFNDTIRSGWFIYIKTAIIIGFLSYAIYCFRYKNFDRIGRISFTFFTAALAMFLGLYLGKYITSLAHLSHASLSGFTLSKLSEDMIIIITILLLNKISGGNRKSLYLTFGKWKLGLLIGVPIFLIISFLAVLQSRLSGISPEFLIRVSPSIFLIVFADGFMEELLFRGLFLKPFSSVIGDRFSNILTAVLFALAHIQITYISEIILFLSVLFVLGLIWGFIIQRTKSLLASVLFHAGADLLIIVPALDSYGITI